MSKQDMERLIALLERHLGGSWREIIERLVADNAIDDIAARIHRGDFNGAVQGVEDAAKEFADAQTIAYGHAADRAAGWLGGAIGDVVHYDEENRTAVDWAERNQIELVREFTAEQRDLVRRVIADGVKAGRNPREVARDIRDSIGLTDYQAQVVANYRTALESQDWSNALGRELTDGRLDRSVAAAQRADRALSSDQIDTMVERYRQNMVAMRAETIARTEGLRIAHQGTRDLFQQAIDRGDVEADSLVREWHHTNAGKDPRADHEAMNGQTRKIDEPFESGSGVKLMYPGDPDAGPAETINCRCAVSTQLLP